MRLVEPGRWGALALLGPFARPRDRSQLDPVDRPGYIQSPEPSAWVPSTPCTRFFHSQNSGRPRTNPSRWLGTSRKDLGGGFPIAVVPGSAVVRTTPTPAPPTRSLGFGAALRQRVGGGLPKFFVLCYNRKMLYPPTHAKFRKQNFSMSRNAVGAGSYA